jgi:hypothetical protein
VVRDDDDNNHHHSFIHVHSAERKETISLPYSRHKYLKKQNAPIFSCPDFDGSQNNAIKAQEPFEQL